MSIKSLPLLATYGDLDRARDILASSRLGYRAPFS
ncbi:hypothetical protein ACVINW_003400 [Bradyrhizobium sp. USDA 4461]